MSRQTGERERLTSSSTSDSTPSSSKRSSHVLMSFGADVASTRFNPVTLLLGQLRFSGFQVGERRSHDSLVPIDLTP